MEKYSQKNQMRYGNYLKSVYLQEVCEMLTIHNSLKNGNLENYVLFLGEDKKKCKIFNIPLNLFKQDIFIADFKNAFNEYIQTEELTSESEELFLIDNKRSAFNKALTRKIEKAETAVAMAKQHHINQEL